MKSTENFHNRRVGCRRLIKWPLVVLSLVAALYRADAADSYYVNDSVLIYPDTVPYPPNIDASNFVNNSEFSINFSTLNVFSPPYYETLDTVNYTNYGSLVVNGGFRFDTQNSRSGARTMAGSFYNAGTVSCGSLDNPDDTLGGILALLGYDQCFINATNIANPGTVDVGIDGLIQVTGKHVDLSRGMLNVEGFSATAAGTGLFDLNTNLWDPSAFLTANFAVTPFFPIAPGILILTNSVAYTNIVELATNYVIIRSVFLQDTSGSNINATVHFGAPPIPQLLGGGDVTIQWAGTYLNPASGNDISTYLYLNDDYVLGASTNVLPVLGLPRNFTFSTFTTPQFTTNTAAVPSQLITSFTAGGITNLYDVFSGQAATGVGTNSIANEAVTNLPGRIQITGSDHLDLTLAQITGANYISITSTNQFEGSAGALIQAPYADLYLGVTNGFLTVSNVMDSSVPEWGGAMVAWNTRWLTVDANGVTNDFRVLVVSSDFTPKIASQAQNLVFHGTNSVVISDTLNVMRSFSLDAQSLTLTTNAVGFGATSFDGEINLESPSILWQSSFPNLRYLTNNGALRAHNLVYFGNQFMTNVVDGTTNVVSYLANTAFINNGIFSDQGSIIYAGNFESSDIVSNGIGSFVLQSLTATLTNGLLYAGGDVSITADTLITSNVVVQACRSLTLSATNELTDTGVTNANNWMVGSNSVGLGLNLPIKPATGDLLGTTITLYAPTNRIVVNTWAGDDYGLSADGFTNNEAVGVLRLDVSGSDVTGHNGVLTFNGAGVSNALYVDTLVLTNFAKNGNSTNNFNFPWLKIANNMTIYYAQALEDGVSVAEAIDDQSKIGANGGRLRWISSYTGYTSSTNLVYTNVDGSVITNTVNTALAQSSTIDSDSDGLPNVMDPTPFLRPSELNFKLTTTNLPANSVKVQWTTIPNATNFVYYTTNLLGTNWLEYTNFGNWYYGNNVAVTNSAHGNSFRSPQVYISNESLSDNAQQTNVWLYDTITNVPHYYKVVVWPWLSFPE